MPIGRTGWNRTEWLESDSTLWDDLDVKSTELAAILSAAKKGQSIELHSQHLVARKALRNAKYIHVQ